MLFICSVHLHLISIFSYQMLNKICVSEEDDIFSSIKLYFLKRYQTSLHVKNYLVTEQSISWWCFLILISVDFNLKLIGYSYHMLHIYAICKKCGGKCGTIWFYSFATIDIIRKTKSGTKWYLFKTVILPAQLRPRSLKQ